MGYDQDHGDLRPTQPGGVLYEWEKGGNLVETKVNGRTVRKI